MWKEKLNINQVNNRKLNQSRDSDNACVPEKTTAPREADRLPPLKWVPEKDEGLGAREDDKVSLRRAGPRLGFPPSFKEGGAKARVSALLTKREP